METQPALELYTTSIYIIDYKDPIEGGATGADSKGNVGNANRFAYLKKINCHIIKGTGAPSGSYGLSVDGNTSSNTFYLDETTQSFWNPVVSGSAITSWINVTKNFVLNVEGISLNDNGDDTNYEKIKYDPASNVTEPGILIYDQYDQLANLRVGSIKYDNAKGVAANQIHIEDAELISNNAIQSQAGNSEGGFDVNNYQVGTTRNRRYFHFLPTRNYWQLYDELGNLLGINVSSVLVNGISLGSATSEEDVIIDSQAEFDLYFNTNPTTGGTTLIDNSYTFRTMTIKSGVYILKNYINISRSNIRINCSPGATIVPIMTSAGIPDYNKMLAWAGWGFDYDFSNNFFSNAWTRLTSGLSLFSILSAINVELNINIDCQNRPYATIVTFTGGTKITSRLRINNVNGGSMFLSDAITSSCMLDYYVGTTTTQPDYIFNGVVGGMLSGKLETPTISIFNNCNNYVFRGTIDGERVYLA